MPPVPRSGLDRLRACRHAGGPSERPRGDLRDWSASLEHPASRGCNRQPPPRILGSPARRPSCRMAPCSPPPAAAVDRQDRRPGPRRRFRGSIEVEPDPTSVLSPVNHVRRERDTRRNRGAHDLAANKVTGCSQQTRPDNKPGYRHHAPPPDPLWVSRFPSRQPLTFASRRVFRRHCPALPSLNPLPTSGRIFSYGF